MNNCDWKHSKCFLVRDLYYVQIEVDFKKHEIGSWLWHDEIGVKMYTFGMNYKSSDKAFYDVYREYIDVFSDLVESYITEYNEDYMVEDDEDVSDPTDDGIIHPMCKDCMKESCVGCDIINNGHPWYPEC